MALCKFCAAMAGAGERLQGAWLRPQLPPLQRLQVGATELCWPWPRCAAAQRAAALWWLSLGGARWQPRSHAWQTQ
eukprot:SM009942S25187  [mRNA]  locus=s9942:48:383:- [translate_table: standard]